MKGNFLENVYVCTISTRNFLRVPCFANATDCMLEKKENRPVRRVVLQYYFYFPSKGRTGAAYVANRLLSV